MKKIMNLTAAALLVAGSIACTERDKPADPSTTTDQPAAVSGTETSATTETSTTVAPVPVDGTATTTDTPVTATDATATSTDATSTSGTTSTPPTQQ